MSDHDPIAEVIARLPNEPVDGVLRRDVERRALNTFEREAGRFARFDRWMLGRIAPAVLSLCVLASAFDLVRYFTRVFGRADAAAGSGQARAPAVPSRVCGRTAIIGCDIVRTPTRTEVDLRAGA